MDIDQVLRSNLTNQQYDAAVDPAREVLCLACAGSGKSRTLAYRIARLLAEKEAPEGIIAFTFTESAAESIKRRVSEALSTAGIDPTVMGAMYIGTIHAYCQRVLGEIDPRFRQFDVLDENRLKLYLMSRFAKLGLKQFRGRAKSRSYFGTIKQTADSWKTANDEMLNYEQIAEEDQELGELLACIRDSLLSDEYIDFSLMVRLAVDRVGDNAEGLKKSLGELRHLMVDEYQDVNPCQEKLIRRLHHRLDSLFVVGDDDQSIYAWRGADVSNILEFNNKYNECTTHTLSQNYRSTDPIVQASDAFVDVTLGPSRIAKNPTAYRNSFPQDFRVLWFPDRAKEADWVAHRIQGLLGTEYIEDESPRGLTPSDFAVIMRSTRMPEQDRTCRHSAFTNSLNSFGIPFSLEAGGGPFDRPQTAVLRNSFELLRDIPLRREIAQQFFDTQVVDAYPYADFDRLVTVFTNWIQMIHRAKGSTRIRLYPQQLVYDLLEAFNVHRSNFDDEIMRDIGLFSRMILDVETVYLSVDSQQRFSDVLNFLNNAAETGYDVSTNDILQRPDAVTVSTIHKMKGLEFPCIFVVDVEAGRFPGRKRKYDGWLPEESMAGAISRGAYQSTMNEQIRLFYTAATRAERYLYVSGTERLPNAKRNSKPSPFALQLKKHSAVTEIPEGLPSGLRRATPHRRIEDADYPTNFTEVKYYLQCPKSYQFRQQYGLNPIIPEMFGFGRTVHTSIQKLHELYPNAPPGRDDLEDAIRDTFHLKHVPKSSDPVNRPGAYETAMNRAVEIGDAYVSDYGSDFRRNRQLEVTFEIPAANCVISGSIDLLLREDEAGNILDAEIVDFKAIGGGNDPTGDGKLDWTELALQVQLYSRAAEQVLGANAKTGSVHLLKDNQRVEVPITDNALDAAIANIEWAVRGILASDFPMRPDPDKCNACDFKSICPRTPQPFLESTGDPPELHLPKGTELARAFSRFEGP